jgi:hypothetical protein
VVDFAVYQNPTGHNWVVDFGLSSAVTGQLPDGGNPPFTNASVSPVDPTGLASLGGASSMGTATFLWTILFGNALLGQNAYSPVLFYTSNSAPVYAGGSISDPSGLNPSNGGIPGQAPEPATLLMWSMGAIGCLITARHRSRKHSNGITEPRPTA